MLIQTQFIAKLHMLIIKIIISKRANKQAISPAVIVWREWHIERSKAIKQFWIEWVEHRKLNTHTQSGIGEYKKQFLNLYIRVYFDSFGIHWRLCPCVNRVDFGLWIIDNGPRELYWMIFRFDNTFMTKKREFIQAKLHSFGFRCEKKNKQIIIIHIIKTLKILVYLLPL